MQDALIRRLYERRDAAVTNRKRIVDLARAERRGDDHLTESEDREFRALGEQIAELDERIRELSVEEERLGVAQSAAARRMGGMWRPESRIYGPESRNSYIRDLVAVSRQTADYDARQRLQQYEQEQRDLNRTDGSGGAFVPPAWLVDEYVGVPRPGRVLADLLTRRPMPAGTDTIQIPKILTGTAVAIQPADNDPVQEVDLTEGSISAPVRTIAGQQDVAVQLLDQSPVNFDEIVIRDLLADYARRLDLQVMSGTGTTGQLLGLRNVSGIETVTWTSATPTAVEFQRRVADAVSRISAATYSTPNVIVMHPRRWAWLLTQNDTANRPLVVPEAGGPSNSLGVQGAGGEGRVGTFAGLPVYVDGNVPTDVNTNQDVVLVLDASDSILFESGIRTRVLQETLSGTLTVRIQAWGYVAVATRQAKSIAVISGTGLAAPSFT